MVWGAMLRLCLPEDKDRAQLLNRAKGRALEPEAEVAAKVREILADVRARGDAAVRELTERFEGRKLEALELSRIEWERLAEPTAPDVRKAIERARERIARFHERQRGGGYLIDENGVQLELRVAPLARV